MAARTVLAMLRLALLIMMLVTLVACDPGGRLAQLTPQPPLATTIPPGLNGEVAPGSVASSTDQPIAGATTAIPTPVPTHDPSIPAWTILYYAVAGGREAFVSGDLNEMEASRPGDQVRIVAQVDWPEQNPAGTAAARYLIQPDEDPASLTSPVVTSLGKVNMGDPATLASFIAWGIQTYPANHYALILGDFGGGWQGCCLDTQAGQDGQGDHLSLPDLDVALSSAGAQTGGARLDIIALSAGLMNQMDVLQYLQPYANYFVGSAGLMPGSTWDYQSTITEIGSDPLAPGGQVAGTMVSSFVNHQRQAQRNEQVGMAAVDLSQLPALAAAVESFAGAISIDPAVNGAIADEARRGAQSYGAAALTEAKRLASVDLHHSAALIGEIAPAGPLKDAATYLSTALAQAVIAYDHGQGITAGRGVSIYWPETPEFLDPHYAQVSRLPGWSAMLSSPPVEAISSTRVSFEGGPRQIVNIANPGLMRSVVTGRHLTEIALVADQEAADGRRVLRQYQTIQPAPLTYPGGTATTSWVDGRHESLIIWDATAYYLSGKGASSDFAALRTVDPSPAGSQLVITGVYQPAGSEKYMEASAAFVGTDPAIRGLWAVGISAPAAGSARLIGEAATAAGDVFRPHIEFVDAGGNVSAEPGIELVFDESGNIHHGTRPLPAGSYAVGVKASALGGAPVLRNQPTIIDYSGAAEGFRAFVVAEQNLQFLYPANWLLPTTQDDVTFASDPAGTVRLQIRDYPDWSESLVELQRQALATFGDVSILQQEATSVGVEPPVDALRTAYGYEEGDGEKRTGVFLTFIKDSSGYVVDIDGPGEQEAATLSTIATVAATWQFLPERLGFGPESWLALEIADFSLQRPSDFVHEEINGWHRLTGGPQTFIAVRIQPAGRSPTEAMSGLLQTASEGVPDFMAEEPRPTVYGGYVWESSNFTYTDANGAIVSGLLLSRSYGDHEIAFWAEAPDPAGEFFQAIFLPVAGSIEPLPLP